MTDDAIEVAHKAQETFDALYAEIDRLRAALVVRSSLMVEHRQCGVPKYDGCYSHFPWVDHCRADGMDWPCDVDRIRAEATPPPLDAFLLGMAMDMTDEEDDRLGVVGRGTKAERIATRYAALTDRAAEEGR